MTMTFITTGTVGDLDLAVVVDSAYTTSYTATKGDLIFVDASAAPVNVTLPQPALGIRVIVRKVDTSPNAVTVLPYASEKINGGSSLSLSKNEPTADLVCDGVNWYTV